MIRTDQGFLYSPSDLHNWMTCAHRSALDALSKTDPDLKTWLKDNEKPRLLVDPEDEDAVAFETPAQLRGDMHERAMFARLQEQGHAILEIDRPAGGLAAIQQAYADTVTAMSSGADVIFQATLLAPPWVGYADFLVRVDGVPSSLGNYAYEVRDTKLARTPSAKALLQMAFYGQVVSTIQGTPPPSLKVWLGNGQEHAWAYSDVEPYLRQAQERFREARELNTPTTAEPIAACASCKWERLCDEQWGPDDLIRVHRLSRTQRAQLIASGLTTIDELARLPEGARIGSIAATTFERLRQQAQIQTGPASFGLVKPQPVDTGLTSVPAADPGDIYFDLEGDPYAGLPTLDYLWAYCDATDTYFHKWAHTPDEERAAFVWFMEEMESRDRAGGDWHVYHYNSYETSSMKRLATGWPDETESYNWMTRVDDLIDRRFVDLYRVVEVGLRTKAGTTSLKEIEKLAGYDRKKDAAGVAKADESIEQYERYTFSRDEAERFEILEAIRHYNEHDVRATHATHTWLLDIAQQLTTDDLLPAAVPYAPSATTQETDAEIASVRDELLAAAHSAPVLPSGLSQRGAIDLAHMLEWHRREFKVAYVNQLRLKDWAVNGDVGSTPVDPRLALLNALNGEQDFTSKAVRPGTEHESCILDVEILDSTPPTRAKGATRYTARCRPGSWKIRAGKKVKEAFPEGDLRKPISTEVVEFDARLGTFTFATTTLRDEYGPFVLSESASTESQMKALLNIARAVLKSTLDPEYRLAVDILNRTPPLDAATMAERPGENAQARGLRLLAIMTSGLLPVQGPPGTGKTWLGGKLVCDAIEQVRAAGRVPVIAVTALSHRVVDNMLVAIIEEAQVRGLPIAAGHAGDGGKVVDHPSIVKTGANKDLVGWIDQNQDEGIPTVAGATTYAWSRDDLVGSADLLVIDEAGQLSIADVLSVSRCAPRAVALGDPQQLAAPVQGRHEDAVTKSLLSYVSNDAAVLPSAVGVFLDETWRMHADVCSVVSDLAYEGELHPAGDALIRTLQGERFSAAGVLVLPQPGVQWIPVEGDGDAEMVAVLQAIEGLTNNITVTDARGNTAPVSTDEILVVAPHNAHVNKLKAAVPDGIRVGTVDLFQGQEAHAVIFSMGKLAEGARDVGFLYEVNRINVALSRARLCALVVSHYDALYPPVATPEDLLLASRFIQAVSPEGSYIVRTSCMSDPLSRVGTTTDRS
jgi:predicted RecB family nuclease